MKGHCTQIGKTRICDERTGIDRSGSMCASDEMVMHDYGSSLNILQPLRLARVVLFRCPIRNLTLQNS